MYDLKWYLKLFSDSDYLIHLWDYDVYSTYRYIKDFFKNKFVWVYGNCDDFQIIQELPEEKILTINWIKILCFHSHSIYPRGDEVWLLEKALENRVNVVFYGHTHIKRIFYFEENEGFRDVKLDSDIFELDSQILNNKIYFINPWALLDGNYLQIVLK